MQQRIRNLSFPAKAANDVVQRPQRLPVVLKNNLTNDDVVYVRLAKTEGALKETRELDKSQGA